MEELDAKTLLEYADLIAYIKDLEEDLNAHVAKYVTDDSEDEEEVSDEEFELDPIFEGVYNEDKDVQDDDLTGEINIPNFKPRTKIQKSKVVYSSAPPKVKQSDKIIRVNDDPTRGNPDFWLVGPASVDNTIQISKIDLDKIHRIDHMTDNTRGLVYRITNRLIKHFIHAPTAYRAYGANIFRSVDRFTEYMYFNVNGFVRTYRGYFCVCTNPATEGSFVVIGNMDLRYKDGFVFKSVYKDIYLVYSRYRELRPNDVVNNNMFTVGKLVPAPLHTRDYGTAQFSFGELLASYANDRVRNINRLAYSTINRIAQSVDQDIDSIGFTGVDKSKIMKGGDQRITLSQNYSSIIKGSGFKVAGDVVYIS